MATTQLWGTSMRAVLGVPRELKRSSMTMERSVSRTMRPLEQWIAPAARY